MFAILSLLFLSAAQAWQIRPTPGYIIPSHYCDVDPIALSLDWEFYDFGLVAKHSNATSFYYYTETPDSSEYYNHPLVVGYSNDNDYDFYATYFAPAAGTCYNHSSGPIYGPIVKFGSLLYLYTPDKLFYVLDKNKQPTPKCDIPIDDRIDCGSIGTTQSMCEESGCCWNPPMYYDGKSSSIPWCYFHPEPREDPYVCPKDFPYICELRDPYIAISRLGQNWTLTLPCNKLQYGNVDNGLTACYMDNTPNIGLRYGPDDDPNWVDFSRFRGEVTTFEPQHTQPGWPWNPYKEIDPKQSAFARRLGLRNLIFFNTDDLGYYSACEEFTGYTHSKFVSGGRMTAYTARACISYLTPAFMSRDTGLYYIRRLNDQYYFHLSLIYDKSVTIECNAGVGEGAFRDRNGVCVYYAEVIRPGNYTTIKLRSFSMNSDEPGVFTNMPGATFTENSLIDFHSETGSQFSILSYPASTHTPPPTFSSVNNPTFTAESSFRVYLFGSNTPIPYERLHGDTFEARSPLLWSKVGTLTQRSSETTLSRNKYYIRTESKDKFVRYTDYVVHRYPWQLTVSIVLAIEIFLWLIGSLRVIYSTYKQKKRISTRMKAVNYTIGGLIYLLLGHLVIIDIAVGILLIIPNTIVVFAAKRYCFLPLSSFAVRKFFKFSNKPIHNYPFVPKLTPLYFSKAAQAKLGLWKTLLCIPFLVSIVLASNPGQTYNAQRVKFESDYSGDQRISTSDFDFMLYPVPNAVTTIAGYDQDGIAVFSADITVTDKTKSDYVCTYQYSGLANKRNKWGFYHSSKEFCACEKMKTPQCLIYEKEHWTPTKDQKSTRNKCKEVDWDGGMSFPDNLETVYLGATEIYTKCCHIGMLGRGQRTTLCSVEPVLGTTHMDVYDCGQMVPTLGLHIIVKDASGSVILDQEYETQEFLTFESDILTLTFDSAGYQPAPPGRVGVLMQNQDVKCVYSQLEAFGISNSAFIKTVGVPTSEGGAVLNVKADVTADYDACRFAQAETFDPGYLDAQYQPLSTYMNCQIDFFPADPITETVYRDCRQRNAPVVTQNDNKYIREVSYLVPQGTLSSSNCGGHISVSAKSIIASSFDADEHSLTADDITCSKCTGHWGTEQAICVCTSATPGLLLVSPTDVYTIPLATVLETSNTPFDLHMVFANPYVTYLTLKDGTNVKLPTDDLEDPTEYVPNPDEDSTHPANDPSIKDDFWSNFSKILIIVGVALAIAAGVITILVILCNLSKTSKNKMIYKTQ